MSRKRRKARDGDAFIRESEQVSGAHDDLAEHLAEEYLRSAVSGEEGEEDARDEVVSEELGGPFIETGPEEEFGRTLQDAQIDAKFGRGHADDAGDEDPRRARPDARKPLGLSDSDADYESEVDTPPNPLPQAVGPLAVAGLDEAIEQRSSAEPISAWHASGWPELSSDEQEDELEPDAEPPSRVEPDAEGLHPKKP